MLLPLLAAVAFATPVHPAPSVEHGLRVTVDSAHHTVTLVGGQYDIAPEMGDMAGMPMGMMDMPVSSLLRFTWPVTGWLRGVRLRIVDGNGKPLPRRLVHHINVINFGRRQLLYDVPERIIAMGQETQDIRIPATIGIPVTGGMPMAAFVMWHNETGKQLTGVSFELTVEYSPTNMVPRPVSVLPVYMDVVNPVGRDVDFDLPAGPTRWTHDFVMPLSGRIIGVGGHIHDYGTGISLLDVTDSTRPRQVVHLATKLQPNGEIVSIDRELPGVTGAGIRLQQGHTYRLVGTYNNPTGKLIELGAMIHMALLYVPDHPDEWPALHPDSPDFKLDSDRLLKHGALPQDVASAARTGP